MTNNLLSALLPAAKNNLLKTLFLGMAFLLYGQVWGQTTSYLGLDGGFEGSATIDNTATGGVIPVASKWSKANANATIANETATVRSGSNSLKVTSNSASTCRIWSPLLTISASTTKWVIQYYRRSASTTNTVQNQTGYYRNSAETTNVSYTTIASINTWEPVVYAPTATTSSTNAAMEVFVKQVGTGGDMYYDDFIMYESSTGQDAAAPNSPGTVTINNPNTNSLDVSWLAASGGVDGGGYMVVRYSSNPNADNDPNQNGIYKVTNTHTNGTGSLVGTVRYVGTSLTFTDNVGLSSGTQYWYKVYTYDKAYNYSAESSGNGTTSSSTPTVNLSVSAATGTEAAGTVITATATASAAVSGNQTLTIAASGTNITAGDYSFSGTTITIPGGGTTGSVTFTIANDVVVEGAETATLTISGPSSGISLGSTTTQNITITDNDQATVNLSVNTNAGTEAAATAVTVTATSSLATEIALSVTVAASGTGITAGDYTLSGGTITIAAGSTTGFVTFTVVNDVVVEGTETATLTISSPTPSTGLALGGTTTQNITITDNDLATVNLSVSPGSGTEAATTVITATATLSTTAPTNQTVDIAVSGTGITAGDYTLSGGTITILAGATTGSVTFTIVDDVLVEGAETATLTISNPSSLLTLGTATQNVTITDNDLASGNLSVSANAGTEAGTTVITATVTATSAVIGDQTFTIAASGTNITAGDYTLSNTTLTILNGQTTGSVTFTIVDDAVVEGSETATLTISNPSSGIQLGTTTTQNVVITDNDLSTVNLTVSASTGSEAAATVITATATISPVAAINQTVDIAASGTGITAGDYSFSGTTITILAGATTGTVTFTIVDDAVVEGSETATLTISNPSSLLTLGTTTRTVAITDNDLATVNLTVSASTGTEAAGTVITATATSSLATEIPLSVTIAASGTNITAGDYSFSGTTITIAAGSTTGTVTFTVVNDVVVEGAETATLTISSPSPASGLALGGTTTQNVAITDNDQATVNLSVSTTTGTEAAATVVTVTATSSLATEIALSVTVAASGTNITAGDYTLSGTTITIAAGATTGSVTFTVVDDAIYEGTETATLTISSPNPSARLALGSTTTQNITITDNEAAPLWTNPITDTDPSASNPYTNGQTVGSANITVSGIGRGSGIAASNPSNRYSASGWSTGSIDLNDYFYFTLTPNSGYEIDFTNFIYTGQVSSTPPTPSIAFRSNANGDNFATNIGSPTVAGTTIDLSGSNYQNVTSAITFRFYAFGLAAGTTTLSINDFTFNGTVSVATPVVNLSINPTSGSEATPGTTITLTATASAAVTGNQTVNLALSGTANSSDVSAIAATISILNGQTQGTTTFTVVDDASNEGPETATFTISSPTSGLVLGSTTAVNFNITDNDVPTITTSGTLNPFTANVGSPSAEQSFTVSGTNLSGNLTVNALSGYAYSLTSGGSFTSTLTVPVSGGIVTGQPRPIYVRLTGVSTGTFSGNINISGGGATAVDVAATGTVIDPNAAADLFISEYGEGSSGSSKYLEIYNKTGASVNLANYRIEKVTNGGGTWNSGGNIPLSGTLANNAVYVMANNATDIPSNVDLYTATGVNWNGDDAVGLSKNISSVWTVIDVIGVESVDPGNGWAVAGIADATKDSRLVRKSSICGPNSNWSASAGTNTTNSEWLVSAYTGGTPSTLGSHTGCSTIPYVELSINTTTGTEAGATAIILTATASGVVTGDQTVYVDLTGTGVTNGDFSGATFQAAIVILNGTASRTLSFNVNDDATINEGTETATFTITSSTSGLTLGTTLAQSLTITDNDVTSITTGAVSTSPFCVSATGTAAGTVAFTSVGTYTSNTFTAQLSDASGLFGSPQNIGTLSLNGVNPSGNISLTIPANISGTGYKIQVVSNSPAFTGTASAAFTVNLGPTNVSSASASTANAQSLVGWINPAICFDDIMVVAKASAFTGAIPNGNGYTCNNSGSFTDGANSTFDGGRVVYKGTSTSQTATNLTNGTLYYFKIFSRKNNDWSAGVITSATPNVVNYASFDNFNRTDNLTVGIPSSGGSTAWSEINTGSNTFRAQVQSNVLRLTSVTSDSTAAVQGKEQVNFDLSSYYNTTFSTASGKLEWYFNMRSQILGNPSGFGSSNYGVAVVLGCDQSDFTNASAKGYAVVIGDAATDNVKLVSFSGGITANGNLTNVALSTQTGLTRYYSVKVTFNPCTNDWALFVNDDGATAFSDPTSVSYGTPVTANVNTHTALNLKYFGALLSHGNSTAGTPGLYVDNISIPITTNGIYTWNASTTDYQVPTAWTPTRSCPQPTDVLQFNNGIPNTVTNVPTQTIARLNVSVSGTIVNLQAAAASNILTLQGGTGTDLDVASGTQLNINGTNDFTIQLATGATGSISGNMTFSNGTHKLKSVDNQSLTFNSGAIFTAGTGFGGNAFGASIVNQPQIVFASGSRYVYQSGGNPFGSAQPNSVLVFQSGSLYKHNSNSGLPSFAGRTYANFEFDFTGAALSSISGSASTCTIGGNMTYTNGTHNFLHQQPINITGNLNITSGNSFNYSPAVASTFNFNGGSAQTIGGGGSITFGANATLQISNNTSLTSTVNVFGIASVTAGTLTSSGNLVIEEGASLLHGVGTTGGGGAVSGNIVVKRTGHTSGSLLWNYWSTPVTNGTLPGTNGYLYNQGTGTNGPGDDGGLNPGTQDPGWAATSGAMSAGRGYASQGSGATSFTGLAGNNDIPFAITTSGQGPSSLSTPSYFNLSGNPYPSALSAAALYTANSGLIDYNFYFWSDDGSGGSTFDANDYAVFSGLGGTTAANGSPIPDGSIGSCQGFFVKATNNGDLTYSNSMRGTDNNQFFKTNAILGRIWLSLQNDTLYNQILLGFADDATDSHDGFYDALKRRGNFHISFAAMQEQDEYCIAAYEPITAEKIIPLSAYVSAGGNYTIRNEADENMGNTPVYLEDRQLGTFTDISNQGEYTAFVDAGENTQRFFLHFGTMITSTGNTIAEPSLVAYTSGNELYVQFSNFTENSGMLVLRDVAGRELFSKANVNTQNGITGINTESIAQGVYFVTLYTANNKYTRKIVIR